MDKHLILDKTAECLSELRKKAPVVHIMTNFVSAGLTARLLTALGARPVMAVHTEESAIITAHSSSLVINTGTPGASSFESFEKALSSAERNGIPAVLDPVGCGFSPFRGEKTADLLDKFNFSVIKGNISEISYLAYGKSSSSGVDADSSSGSPLNAAARCAGCYSAVTAVTGKSDHVSQGEQSFIIGGGSPYMSRISGTGCFAGGVTGAFLATGTDPLTAACASSILIRTAALLADLKADGPGTFLSLLADTLYGIGKNEILEKGVIDEI